MLAEAEAMNHAVSEADRARMPERLVEETHRPAKGRRHGERGRSAIQRGQFLVLFLACEEI